MGPRRSRRNGFRKLYTSLLSASGRLLLSILQNLAYTGFRKIGWKTQAWKTEK